MAKKLPLISVVVCSLNGADVITDALKAIKAQKWAGKLEIIVVDDGSTDDTYKIAKSFKGIKIIKNKKNLGLAASRNIGVKATRGEIVAFTDDDCRPEPTWIKELYAGYTSDKILGVGGNVISKDKSSLILRYLHYNNPLKPLENKTVKSRNIFYRFSSYLKDITGLSRTIPNRKRSVYSFGTNSASFRKSALRKVGIFDEWFIFAGEDVDLCKRLNDIIPESTWLVPKARVVHQFDSNLADTLRRSKAYGVGNAQLSRKDKDYFSPVYPFPIVIILSLLLGLINPLFLLIPFVLVLVIYSQWARLAIKKGSFEPLLYGYLQCLQEWYHNIGLIEGWWKFRDTFKNPITRAKSRIDNSFRSREFNFSISASHDVADKPTVENNKFWNKGNN
jgi:glycosyltransferase involved in cell wall biosynthesis